MDKRELVLIMLIIALLSAIAVFSGMLYFNWISADVPTGHVVFNGEEENNFPDSAGDSILVNNLEAPNENQDESLS